MNQYLDPDKLTQFQAAVTRTLPLPVRSPSKLLACLSSLTGLLSKESLPISVGQFAYTIKGRPPLKRALLRDLSIPLAILLHLLSALECDLSDLVPWLLSLRTPQRPLRGQISFMIPTMPGNQILSPSSEEPLTLLSGSPVHTELSPDKDYLIVTIPLKD
jgi:hypothetical protein